MKRVLLVATVQSHIAQFHKILIQLLHDHGVEVHVAARNNLSEKNGLKLDEPDKIFDIDFSRSPINKDNITAYKQLCAILKENQYDVIHCNTPMGGVLARLAGNKYRKNGTKIFYTAHGFHFYKGASFLNWITYYPIEKLFAKYTDKLITINAADYQLACKKFKTDVYRIHGVGVDDKRFYPFSEDNKTKIRNEFGVGEEKLLLCVGELNKNKNQAMAIRAMKNIVREFPDCKLLIAGNGKLDNDLKMLVSELSLSEHVVFLGYCINLEKYYNICDVFVACSKREGLGLNIIEAMLCKKAVVASYNRGHCELVIPEGNGFLVDSDNDQALSDKVIALLSDAEKLLNFSEMGFERAQRYTSDCIIKELENVYDIS